MRKVLFFILVILPLGLFAQFNTDRLMVTGRSALFYEDYVLSIQYFNQIINVKPYLYDAWFFRGVAKFYLDDFVGAEKDVTEAINLNPYISDIYELRGLCRINQKNFKGAIADYDKSLEFNPWNYNVWYNRTLCRIEDKEYERAQADLDTMVNRWKTNAKAYSLKAEVFLMQKDTTKADEWLGKSLDIDPYNADAWSAKAMIGLSRSEWSEAAACLDKAIHLKPQNVPNYVNRGLARYNLNNLRGAMADYDKAIDLDPNNFMARYNRGLLGMQLGDDNRAITDFDYVIRMEPDNVMAIFNRALLHDRTGDLKSAIKDYTTVINQFPNFWTGLARRAACYRRLGMTAKAELDEFKILKAQMDKHQGKQPRWSASKTKQMRKRSDIDPEKYNQIVVADESIGVEGTSIYLRKDEEIRVIDLLYGLMLRSGNDSATALACHVAGGVDEFADMMNETAEKVGATSSHFTNPHGLDDPDHYTTAYDLSLITAYALSNPTFKEIVSTRNYVMEATNKSDKRYLTNKNKLLSRLDGCVGVKTGFTSKAGRCLVSACERDDMTTVCVVLNCGPMFEESATLLNGCANRFKKVEITSLYNYNNEVEVLDGREKTAKIGTKETFKVPSANKLRNKFGNRNATKKASDSIVAPKYLAINTSRINPIIRLSMVKPLTVAIDFNSDIFDL